MDNQLFVNKFRPQTLEDFELDADFLHILRTILSTNTMNILLVGSPGTGKTAIIDTLMAEYYTNTPSAKYSKNILSINNLKDQGINYYRNDVKNFCQTTSGVHGKKKCVVMDDIDFMNEQSQQVFRNSIDKYQNKVHFIASCTNIQKVIDSIQSRFLIIKINPIQCDGLYTIMKKVVCSENISIDPDAIDFVIDVCNLSIKAMMNYLEKFKLIDDHITLTTAIQTCTNISFMVFETYTTHIREHRLYDAIMMLYDLHDKGYSVMDILDSYFSFVKMTHVFSEDEKYQLIPIICKYIAIFHEIHEDEIELSLFTNNIYKRIAMTK